MLASSDKQKRSNESLGARKQAWNSSTRLTSSPFNRSMGVLSTVGTAAGTLSASAAGYPSSLTHSPRLNGNAGVCLRRPFTPSRTNSASDESFLGSSSRPSTKGSAMPKRKSVGFTKGIKESSSSSSISSLTSSPGNPLNDIISRTQRDKDPYEIISKPGSRASYQVLTIQKTGSVDLGGTFEKLLQSQNRTDRELRDSLRVLRKMILMYGLPEMDRDGEHQDTLRGNLWKVLLGIYKTSGLEYMTLVNRGPCDVYDKIKNDTFRTLATNVKFLKVVDESTLSRVLNAFVWKSKDLPPSRLIHLSFSYVQGMNVIAAPFLYVMPELDAFYTFSSFIQHACPLYVQPALEGVHCGVKLLDRCMKTLEPSLYSHLLSKGLTATVYAFPSVLTFSACTPPLEQVLRLWDFLFSYGIHLNIVCIVAQLVLMKQELMKSSSPMKLLRQLPELNAKKIISLTLELMPNIPEDLYDMLVRHPFDPTIFDVILPECENEEHDGSSEKS